MSIKTAAILGGAFDPVHEDHLALASACLALKLCDEVWFVPSPDRWDKTLIASPEDRFKMLQLAVGNNPHFIVSDIEINMNDYRGSYVSMQHIQEMYPDYHFRLLVGADSYEGIPRWRDPLHFYGTEYNGHLLLRDFELIIFGRHGYKEPDVKKHIEAGYAPLFCVGAEQGFNGTISSTAIRKSLLCSRDKPAGLSQVVYEYILNRGLYEE